MLNIFFPIYVFLVYWADLKHLRSGVMFSSPQKIWPNQISCSGFAFKETVGKAYFKVTLHL